MLFRLAVLLIFLASVPVQAYTLAAEDDYYPYSAQVDGELVGMVPDLARAAFAAVGVEVDFIIRPYSRVLMMVERGQALGGFAGSIDDSNRSAFFWHETPLDIVRLVIWARKGESETGLSAKDMEGQKVSITRGFFYTDAIDQNESVKKIEAPSDASSMQMLAIGRSNYALVTELIGHEIVQSSSAPVLDGRLEIVGLIEEVPLHAFFSRTHPDGEEAATLFQQGLEIIFQNGEYQRIHERWLPTADAG
ncbi:substrate-binding periplasmic protein [Marinobacter sp.]|uniref:substrate-binding periplasmic protein n=1 Tax=Marinobacter sp. TaxID=50741 RepID=UPI003850EA4D